ncbi:MAG: OmpA family protein, partial [Flavisolibacter sp.]
YFTQWKKDTGHVAAIYYSSKTANGWSKPMLLNSVNETGHNSKQPHCSADGKYLYFSSDRTGGQGGYDIWYAPINADGTTGEAVNAGSRLNSSSNEQAPFYHNAAGTLVFASDRTPGMGGYDLFSAKGTATEWRAAENMGHPVNSSRDDVYFYSAGDGALLDNAFFSSDRGAECCLETYTISKTAKKKMITGVINDCRDNAPLADAAVIVKDKDGNTKQLTTASDGRYSFEWNSDGQRQLFVSKEKYMDKDAEILINGKNESNWQTDTMYNTTMCLEKKLVIKVENVVTVYFDFDKSEIKQRGTAQLDSIYNVLMNDTTFTIQISGYTDGRGTVEYNSVLSDKRAKACAEYLIEKGLDPNRISFFSFGACCPVEMELINGRDNAAGRSRNRRALINISKE